ncbi:hypothetical protein POM88_005563 [Heracleum sosnowskyi]|uniref:lipoyl(octanoyl) transferase n=1 Tax=Heracleum sosnowskyi TaxID=360622 RepID=A0AAD8MZ89_9APIA|nr:hypothetical protein POM88_005563 [Heracleum sosnowskyi]
MAPKQSTTRLSPSGRVEYAVTNHVAFLDKQSVDKDLHPLMDFFKISPVSYALTASPTIYAEIVQEMWTSAFCSQGQIKLKIKGKSYIITPSAINQALHLPVSNFEKLPTDEEILAMLKFIKYASKSRQLSDIISRNYLRKEWSYFFDTLSKVFTSRCGSYVEVTKIKDRDDTLPVCVQTVSYFGYIVGGNFKLVLPDHIQAQLSTLSPCCSHSDSSLVHDIKEMMGKDPIPSTKATLPSQFQSGKEATNSVNGKRKKTVPPTVTAGRREENEEVIEVNPPNKKKETSIVKPQTGLLDVDPIMPPGFSWDRVLVVDLPSCPGEEKPKCDLPFVPEHTPEPDSLGEDILQDRQHLVNQHLVNTASILKSQLVTCLTSSADKLSPSDMINLANRSYNALKAFGDDYSSFGKEVNRLIARRQMLEYAAKTKENNEQDLNARYIQQKRSVSDMEIKFVIAQEKLFRAESNVESLKLKKEELTCALVKLTEELSEEEKRVATLAAERDQCKESYSGAEAQLRKLDAEKDEARVAFKAINDQYNAAKDEFERMNSQLLQCDVFDMHNELIPYAEAWSWQKSIVEERKKLIDKNQDFCDSVIILQHPPVYTLGTGSSEGHLNGIKDFYRTERGGEVTYHGPGQLVMYPILNLRYHTMDLHWYLRALEEVVMRVLSSTFSIKASRHEGLTGVWVGMLCNHLVDICQYMPRDIYISTRA